MADRRLLWAVWFRDHIHTDAEQKLAVFRTKKIATAWARTEGRGMDCTVRRLELNETLQEQ